MVRSRRMEALLVHPNFLNIIGNFKQFFSRTGWDFYSHLNHNFGPVVRFRGMLGVRSTCYVYAILKLTGRVIGQMSLRL